MIDRADRTSRAGKLSDQVHNPLQDSPSSAIKRTDRADGSRGSTVLYLSFESEVTLCVRVYECTSGDLDLRRVGSEWGYMDTRVRLLFLDL